MSIFATARRVATVGLLTFVGAAWAEESKISIGEIPKPVIEAVRRKFPACEMIQAQKETEDGKITYEIGLKDKGAMVDVAVTASGKIVEIEKVITPKDLPRAVMSSVEVKYPGATINKVEQIVEFEDDEEEISYEVSLTTKDKKSLELNLSPKGKIIEDEKEEHEGKGDKKD